MYFFCDFTLIHFQFFRKDPGYFFRFGHLAVDHGDRTDRLVGCQDNSITVQDFSSGCFDLPFPLMKILCQFLIMFRIKYHQIK